MKYTKSNNWPSEIPVPSRSDLYGAGFCPPSVFVHEAFTPQLGCYVYCHFCCELVRISLDRRLKTRQDGHGVGLQCHCEALRDAIIESLDSNTKTALSSMCCEDAVVPTLPIKDPDSEYIAEASPGVMTEVVDEALLFGHLESVYVFCVNLITSFDTTEYPNHYLHPL